jgi:hypothetical protein
MKQKQAEGSNIKAEREAFDRMMKEKEDKMEAERKKNAEELDKMMQ